jgi:hypothetical protein
MTQPQTCANRACFDPLPADPPSLGWKLVANRLWCPLHVSTPRAKVAQLEADIKRYGDNKRRLLRLWEAKTADLEDLEAEAKARGVSRKDDPHLNRALAHLEKTVAQLETDISRMQRFERAAVQYFEDYKNSL